MNNALSNAFDSSPKGRDVDGAKKPLRRLLTISNKWDWDQPAWSLDLEHRSSGATQKLQLVIFGNTLVFGLPRTPGSNEIDWLVVPNTVVVSQTPYVEVFATAHKSGWKDGVSIRMILFADAKSLEFIEHDPKDRVRFLSLFGGIFPPVR